MKTEYEKDFFKDIKEEIGEKIDKETETELKNFENRLTHNRDYYINEVMKGINIAISRPCYGDWDRFEIVFRNIHENKDETKNRR